MVNSSSRLTIENINLKNGMFRMLASSDLILRDATLENTGSYMINLNASSGGTYNIYLEEGATVSPAEVFATFNGKYLLWSRNNELCVGRRFIRNTEPLVLS